MLRLTLFFYDSIDQITGVLRGPGNYIYIEDKLGSVVIKLGVNLLSRQGVFNLSILKKKK